MVTTFQGILLCAVLCCVGARFVIHSDYYAEVPYEYRCTWRCPENMRIVNCFAAPCQVSPCQSLPESVKCCNDYCGGCNAFFYINATNQGIQQRVYLDNVLQC